MAQQSTLEFLVAAQVTGQEQIARLINDTDKLNKTTKGLQSAFAQMGGAARSLSEVQKNAAAIDAARAEKIARLSQEFYNNALAIDRTSKSARDSASVFEEAFRAEEMAAKAQRDMAAAAADLRAKLDPMIPIQNRFNAEMDHATNLFKAGAISQKEYAQATTVARQNLYSAQQALIGLEQAQNGVIINGVRYNSMADYQSKILKSHRQGVQQLGMQFNDLATSVTTGANPIMAFNQQLGQMGYAMSQMKGRAGEMGKFLMGPWGTALQIGAMAVGFLVAKLLESDDASQRAKESNYDFSQAVDFSALSVDAFGKALDQLNERTRTAIGVQQSLTTALYNNAKIAQIDANARLQQATQDKRDINDRMSGWKRFIPFIGASADEIIKVQKNFISASRDANIANQAFENINIAIMQRGVNESLDKRAKITREYEDAVGALNAKYQSNDPLVKISNAQYTKQYEVLTRAKDAALKLADAEKRAENAKPKRPKAVSETDKLRAAQQGVINSFKTGTISAAEFEVALKAVTNGYKQAKNPADEYLKEWDRQDKVAEKFRNTLESLSQSTAPEWEQKLNELNAQYKELSATTRLTAADTEGFNNAIKGLLTGPIDEQIKKYDELIAKANGVDEGFGAMRAALIARATEQGVGVEEVMAKLAILDQKMADLKIAERNAEIKKSFEDIGRSVSDAFKGMLTGATSWKDGMKSIIGAVIDKLWELFVVQKIVGFVTKALGGLTGGPAAPTTTASGVALANSMFSGVQFGNNANGTQNWGGGMTWVGERGPELVNLPRGSQVIPAHRAQSMGGGGINITVDARGSSDPAAVRAQVEAGILQAAPAIIAAAQQRTVSGLRRPKLGGVMQ